MVDFDTGAQRGRPLVEVDAGLAERLAARLVDRFLSGAGLSNNHRAEALAQTKFFVASAGDGHWEMDVALPLSSGNPSGSSWDGSVGRAEEVADDCADVGIEEVRWEREHIGPTGWEPEFDDG
jgi:hypothetical protein